MKIVQVSAHYPPHLGGIQNVAREISERLAKRGHSVEVFTSNIGCPKEKQLKSSGNLKINYLQALEFAHTPIIFSLFWKLMKIPKDSIIHLHIAQAFIPEVVWLVSKIKGIKYFSHVHGDTEPSGKLGFLLEIYKKYVLKKVLKDGERIITLNKDYQNLISQKYCINKDKISVIPNATDFKIS